MPLVNLRGSLQLAGPLSRFEAADVCTKLLMQQRHHFWMQVQTSSSAKDHKAIAEWVDRTFGGSPTQQERAGHFKFLLPGGMCSLAAVFRSCETIKGTLSIDAYSVNQPTLDEVFCAIATDSTGLTDSPH